MLSALRRLLLALGTMLLVAMVVIVSIQIVYRYALGNPLIWTEEVARLVFLWTIFLGAAYAATREAHLRLDLYAGDRFALMRRVSRVTGAIATLAFSGVVVYAGWRIVDLTASRPLPGTGLSYAWFHAAAPIGSALTILGVLLVLLGARRRRGPERSDR